MSFFKIRGGVQLKGDIEPQGAKNEALQVLCAVLLTSDEVIISNIPKIVDVENLIKIIENLGVKKKEIPHPKRTFSFRANDINLDYLYSDQYRKDASKIRGTVMLLGPLLARFGKAIIPLPGGDKIGRRRLDTHFGGLKKLGASFFYNNKNKTYNLSSASKLKGNYLLLEDASVTGTANMIMAAALAEGNTTIYNAACEPYIQQLCAMIIKMGVKIEGVGSNLLTIEGANNLKGTTHEILPDIIEIGSWIGVAAMTQSELTIKNINWKFLGQIPDVFRRLGIAIEKKGEKDMHIPMLNKKYKINNFVDDSILTISDAPWPGFTPDLLSIILVIATQAAGSVLIHQKMFESRLFFVDKLIDMGAKIILCDPHRATVIGHGFKPKLKAIRMSSPDIRAGIALLIAALSAKGTSYIYEIEQIDRGYENIDARLRQLGANITRE